LEVAELKFDLVPVAVKTDCSHLASSCLVPAIKRQVRFLAFFRQSCSVFYGLLFTLFSFERKESNKPASLQAGKSSRVGQKHSPADPDTHAPVT